MKTFIRVQYLVGESVNAVTYWTTTKVSVQRNGPSVHLIFPDGNGHSLTEVNIGFVTFANSPHVVRSEGA